MDHDDHDVPLRMIFFLTSAEVMFIFSLLLAACLHPDVTVGVALGLGPGLCQVGQGAGIGRLLGRIFQRKRTAKPGGSACRWLWMAVDGCGWLWMAVDGCGDFRDAFGGIFSNLFGVKFRGTNLAGDIMLWYGSVGRDLVMVADLMVILTMATKEVCIELIEVPC